MKVIGSVMRILGYPTLTEYVATRAEVQMLQAQLQGAVDKTARLTEELGRTRTIITNLNGREQEAVSRIGFLEAALQDAREKIAGLEGERLNCLSYEGSRTLRNMIAEAWDMTASLNIRMTLRFGPLQHNAVDDQEGSEHDIPQLEAYIGHPVAAVKNNKELISHVRGIQRKLKRAHEYGWPSVVRIVSQP